MRAAIKEDIGFSAAEMVYGSTLRLPGEFISPMDQLNTDEATGYVRQLKKTIQSLRPIPTRKSKKLPFIEPSLADCTHVFVRNNTVRKPLQPPYDGPFLVLQRRAHAFEIERKGERDSVIIDRLKAAFLDSEVSRRPCDAEAPNQQNSNASSHISRSTHQLSKPESTAGRSSASSSASTRRPISVDGHRSAKVVRFQIDDPCGSSDESSISNPTPLAGAVPRPNAQFRHPCLKRSLIPPSTRVLRSSHYRTLRRRYPQ